MITPGEGILKTVANPMHPTRRLQDAPRCSARSKRSGDGCKAPAVNGWTVWRMHGAGGGAPSGKANGQWKDGLQSKSAVSIRRLVSTLMIIAPG